MRIKYTSVILKCAWILKTISRKKYVDLHKESDLCSSINLGLTEQAKKYNIWTKTKHLLSSQ